VYCLIDDWLKKLPIILRHRGYSPAFSDAEVMTLEVGDIGQHFPDTAADYANIDSRILLRHVYGLVKARGYVIGNLDSTIVAQAPKMAPHIVAMRECIAADLECAIDQISVKATTTEKLGFAGRKEGIAAHAVVLLGVSHV
jgi:2-C-methyl-D-erythritol 2,4-cyclodiphosphate synthase